MVVVGVCARAGIMIISVTQKYEMLCEHNILLFSAITKSEYRRRLYKRIDRFFRRSSASIISHGFSLYTTITVIIVPGSYRKTRYGFFLLFFFFKFMFSNISITKSSMWILLRKRY